MTNCFCDAKMATQKSGMEFSKKGGDEFVVDGKPQLAVVEYKAMLKRKFRMRLWGVLNLLW